MSQKDTTAGDEPIRIVPNYEDVRAPAEDFAAALDDDAPVDRIVQKYDLDHVKSVSVWIDADAGGDDGASIREPGDWEQTATFVTSGGSVAVRFEREPPEVED
jgi:hypothetical protein